MKRNIILLFFFLFCIFTFRRLFHFLCVIIWLRITAVCRYGFTFRFFSTSFRLFIIKRGCACVFFFFCFFLMMMMLMMVVRVTVRFTSNTRWNVRSKKFDLQMRMPKMEIMIKYFSCGICLKL